jgi:uncharacterized protein YbbC (DUF1343 family)
MMLNMFVQMNWTSMGRDYKQRNGIDVLLEDLDALKGKRVGLISNQASLTEHFIPSAYELQKRLGTSLSCLFTLEHGWSAFCPAGEAIGNDREPSTNLPIYSLYGPLFAQNVEHLQALDYVIIDIQDVGVRCYTYAATCAKVIEHASRQKYGVEFIVCDRPNPLGKKASGPRFDPAFRSLVSYIDVPYQHGKTIAELLHGHNQTLENPVALSSIASTDTFDPRSHIWIPPSPGLPDWQAVFLYPGLVLLEGTNVSEGRGSTLPFRCVAAPGLDVQLLQKSIPNQHVVTNPFTFVPNTGKLNGQQCQGVQLHVTDFKNVDAFALGVHILHALYHHYPAFEWIHMGKSEKYWIDAITGNTELRTAIEAGQDPETILKSLN